MKRMEFDSRGRLLSVDAKIVDFEFKDEPSRLQTSENLQFLQDKKFENVKDSSSWSLYKSNEPLAPLKFSNSKTQEDIVNEVASLINSGTKVIFLQGVCGTGKSAIALNVARSLGRASIVVPIKNLQKQYEQDYMGDKYVLKKNGQMLKIAMITGRENHDSILKPGVSCADPTLPDTIKLTEKNYHLIREYYHENPYIKNKSNPDLKHIKRISIAPANPHWSPILPEAFKLDYMKDAKKKKYLGLEGKEFIFYHRLPGCSYYDQYLAYIDADVIIFNAAKYKIETALGRKPATDIEIVDEADEFLDSLANQIEINLSHLATALKLLVPESGEAQKTIDSLTELLELEHKNKLALGVNEEEIFELKDTKFRKFLELLGKDSELIAEILLDEANYANKALEAFELFSDSLDETFATFRKQDKDLYVNLLSTNLAQKVRNIVSKNKAILFMSGTLHSSQVLKNIFGIDDFKIVKAETINQGAVEIMRTGKEFDCRYSNLSSRNNGRKDYLEALDLCIAKAKRPTLVHVNAFSDLPNEEEKIKFSLKYVISSDSLRSQQNEDKSGATIKNFKLGQSNLLFSTRASRGIDFPGNVCNSIVFTKYPNPNTKDIFWKILERTHKDHFWEFYKDKAQRELLQRIYRAVRSQDDHVYILSPDTRVLDAVKQLQMEAHKAQKQANI